MRMALTILSCLGLALSLVLSISLTAAHAAAVAEGAFKRTEKVWALDAFARTNSTAVFAFSPTAPAQAGTERAESSIIPAGAKLELLYTRTAPIQGGLTGGAAAGPDGSLYFSDFPAGRDKGMILRFDPKTGKTTTFTEDSGKANGLAGK